MHSVWLSAKMFFLLDLNLRILWPLVTHTPFLFFHSINSTQLTGAVNIMFKNGQQITEYQTCNAFEISAT